MAASQVEVPEDEVKLALSQERVKTVKTNSKSRISDIPI